MARAKTRKGRKRTQYKARKRKLGVADLDLLSPEMLALAAQYEKKIRKREAASMQRLLDSERITEKDLQVTINARG